MRARIVFLTVVLFSWSCPDLCAEDLAGRPVSKLTLRQKVGQLLLLGIQGKDLDAATIAHMKKLSPGGVVFYRRNIGDASDIAQLITKIKNVNRNGVPMFFAVDQEGWIVHRIGGVYYTPPSAPTIGVIGSEQLARETGLSVARSLRGLGININLAPVLDVPSDIFVSPMTSRCFSSDFRAVETLGTSYIRGLRDGGLLATAKHFPGIGRAPGDTHYKLPRIRWENSLEKDHDVLPFASAIKADVDMVMVGHVIAEPGDRTNPVSLSPYWMREVLRREMGFKGLIIVDNIEMKAIEGMVSIPDAAVRAFNSGADIIMVSHERKNQKAVFDALLNAVRKGDISAKRLNDSLTRILEAKKRMTSHDSKEPRNDLPTLSKLAAEASVVDIKSKDVPSGDIARENRVLYAGGNLPLFDVLKEFFSYAGVLDIPLSQYKETKPDIALDDFLRGFTGVIIDATYPDAAALVARCRELNLEYVVVLSSYPSYALDAISRLRPKRIVITFENSQPHLYAAAEIISGLRQPKGRLPYNLNLPANYTY